MNQMIVDNRRVDAPAASRLAGRLGSKGRRVAVAACLSLGMVEAVAVGLCYSHERITLHLHRWDITPQDDLTDGLFAFYAPGIDRPPIREARVVRLPDEEQILGVQVDGRYRAYRVNSLRDRSHHILNDVIGDRPVTVSYCDINDFARAVKGDEQGAPLPISQGGVFSGGMILCVDGAEYAQQTLKSSRRGTSVPPFPYQTISVVRTTWKVWRERHPQTDVFEGFEGG